MVVDIGQTKNSSRENPKFSAAIVDFDIREYKSSLVGNHQVIDI